MAHLTQLPVLHPAMPVSDPGEDQATEGTWDGVPNRGHIRHIGGRIDLEGVGNHRSARSPAL
jgi:hypothetical protein